MTNKTYKVIVDGYFVGDRLLLGVDFIVYFSFAAATGAYKIIEVSLANPNDIDYLNMLNSEYWLKKVYDYVGELITEDMLGSFPIEEVK